MSKTGHHCSMMSNGDGAIASATSETTASMFTGSRGAGVASGGAAGCPGAADRRTRSRRADRVRRAASCSAARISSTAANRAASHLAPVAEPQMPSRQTVLPK